ncbi:MAG: MOFRL family protein [Lachnospirales bacterium]
MRPGRRGTFWRRWPEAIKTPTVLWLSWRGADLFGVLRDNDAYHALAACGGLIVTGGTGTNVNDVSVVLIRR